MEKLHKIGMIDDKTMPEFDKMKDASVKIQSLKSLRDEMVAVAKGEHTAPSDANVQSFDLNAAIAEVATLMYAEPGTPEFARLDALAEQIVAYEIQDALNKS